MFHVPISGRITIGSYGSTEDFGNYGAFIIPSPEPGWVLYLICAGADIPEAEGWEHVSVHAENSSNRQRTPTWKEMAFVKNLCWDEDDIVVQYHPRKQDYVNLHPHVLHLWRWTLGDFPTPPKGFV